MSTFPRQETTLNINGPVGQLEAITTWPESGEPKGVAIICHPHPQYRGTMRNKVVTTLAKTMEQIGLATVRFNYRGVGASEGSYGEIQGEIEDLEAVQAWVGQVLPELDTWLLGFSFGSFISASVANREHDVVQLINVAPAVNHTDYQQLTDIRCPWLMIHGELDDVVPYSEVKTFAKNPPSPVKLISMPETTHFFHGKLVELRENILKNIELP